MTEEEIDRLEQEIDAFLDEAMFRADLEERMDEAMLWDDVTEM